MEKWMSKFSYVYRSRKHCKCKYLKLIVAILQCFVADKSYYQTRPLPDNRGHKNVSKSSDDRSIIIRTHESVYIYYVTVICVSNKSVFRMGRLLLPFFCHNLFVEAIIARLFCIMKILTEAWEGSPDHRASIDPQSPDDDYILSCISVWDFIDIEPHACLQFFLLWYEYNLNVFIHLGLN